MKKFICLLLCLTIFICSGCTSKNGDNNTTTKTEASTTEKNPENSSDIEKSTESTTSDSSTTGSQMGSQVGEKDSTTTTKKHSGNSLLSDEEIEKIENSEAEVFFTDNPDNEYITVISEKYGVKKENLVALIKMNAEYPTITLFEFSGKKDKNGELIMTYDEFKFLYKIYQEDNRIIKASKNGWNNDGIGFIEAKVNVFLAKKFLIPELPALKANKPYIE